MAFVDKLSCIMKFSACKVVKYEYIFSSHRKSALHKVCNWNFPIKFLESNSLWLFLPSFFPSSRLRASEGRRLTFDPPSPLDPSFIPQPFVSISLESNLIFFPPSLIYTFFFRFLSQNLSWKKPYILFFSYPEGFRLPSAFLCQASHDRSTSVSLFFLALVLPSAFLLKIINGKSHTFFPQDIFFLPPDFLFKTFHDKALHTVLFLYFPFPFSAFLEWVFHERSPTLFLPQMSFFFLQSSFSKPLMKEVERCLFFHLLLLLLPELPQGYRADLNHKQTCSWASTIRGRVGYLPASQ